MRLPKHGITPMAALLCLAACGTTEPGTERVSVNGGLFQQGGVTGSVTTTLGVPGRTDPVAVITHPADGTYSIAGEVESADCESVFVRVVVTDCFGSIGWRCD